MAGERTIASLPFTIAAGILIVGLSACGGSGAGGGNASSTIEVAIAPASASVSAAGGTTRFTATVTHSDDTSVIWQVNAVPGGNNVVGTITSDGLYTAPSSVPNPSAVTVAAVAHADSNKSATALVTILPPTPPIAISVTPTEADLAPGAVMQLTATVTNTTNTGVAWSVNGNVGGNANVGTVSSSGLYTAPATVTDKLTVTISAVSVADATKVATATITITPPISVTTSPMQGCLHAGNTANLAALVTNDASNAGVTWSISGSGCASGLCGSLSSTAANPVTYSAPPAVSMPATVAITARSNTDPARSSATSITLLPTGISITVSPRHAALTTSQRQPFSANLSNACDSTVTWSVDGVTGGNSTVGTIDSGGTYLPPSSPGVHIVAATSIEDSSKSGSVTVAVTDLAAIPTYHYDNARTGQNTHEYALTPAVVHTGSFGKLFACSVDGHIYAEPLYAANLTIAGGVHNVIFVATEHDSVYAFDADNPSCRQYWHASFLTAGATTIPATEAGEAGNLPEVGITGTPVLDVTKGSLFVVAATKENNSYFQRLHALDLSSGMEKANSPVTITGSATMAFNALIENQRAALVLANNVVYVAWASHDDRGPYHGIIMGFDEISLGPVSAFNATPHGTQGGIWMSGSGPATDSAGSLYLSTGNGTFDNFTGAIPPVSPNDDHGDSVVKLSTASGLALSGFFTPMDQAFLQTYDYDMGSGGVVLLPDEFGSSAHPHLLLAGDKLGRLFLLDRDNLGGYTANGPDQDLQAISVTTPNSANAALFSTPAVWNGMVFIAPGGDALKAFPLSSASLSVTATSQSSDTQGFMGASPVVTSQGTTNGIVWTLDTDASGTVLASPVGPTILRAYDATNVHFLLYSSDSLPTDQCGNAIKFTVPTIANGKVYVGGQSQITVYGLLP